MEMDKLFEEERELYAEELRKELHDLKEALQVAQKQEESTQFRMTIVDRTAQKARGHGGNPALGELEKELGILKSRLEQQHEITETANISLKTRGWALELLLRALES